MADVERWAIITPHPPGILQIEFPVYPSEEAAEAVRRKVRPIHGAELPPFGQDEVILAQFHSPSLSEQTQFKLRRVHADDPEALPSVIRELTQFEEENADLTLPARACIFRVVGALERIIDADDSVQA